MDLVVENGNTFEFFSDLFPEIRQCIVDEMEPTDRVRFTRCSKRSSKEAKRSKNYIYGFTIDGQSEKDLRIGIEYDKCDENFELVGFIMRFQEVNGSKFQSYLNSKSQELWKEELNESTDLVRLVGEQFKSLLKKYQNRIKDLSFDGNVFKDYDFEIDSMNCLEQLTMSGNMNFAYYFSKLRNPLSTLYIREGGNNQKLANFEQVYQVEDTIVSVGQTFSYEQFLRISAQELFINIGDLTENNIASIIRSWQNETPARKNLNYWWYFHDSEFDVFELLRLLGLTHNGFTDTFRIEIKHNNDVGKVAQLNYFKISTSYRLIFNTHQPR